MLDSGKERDNIHFSILDDDGYGKPFVYVFSPREPGKTTSMILDKVYPAFKRETPFVIMVNKIAEVTDELVLSFETTVNTFKGYEVHLEPKGTFQGGVRTVYTAGNKKERKIFCYIIAWSTPLTRLKRINLGKIGGVWFDEAQPNVAIGEKYEKGLAQKWNEFMTTVNRNSYPKVCRCYFTSNFYSRYHPVLEYLGVNSKQLEIGKKFTGKDWLVDCYQLKPELREYILKHNPYYQFDDTYNKYFQGIAIADENVPIQEDKPEGCQLYAAFKTDYGYLWIWKQTILRPGCNAFWIDLTKERPGKRTDVFIVDFKDMDGLGYMLKPYVSLFGSLKAHMANGKALFSSPGAFQACADVWSML